MAKDLFHESVRQALINDGWNITDDPFHLYDETRGIDYEADLGAEKVITAQKDTQKIVVEIKSFLRLSLKNEFHAILGQYMTYVAALTDLGIPRDLFLAIPHKAFMRIQREPFIQRLIELHHVKFFVYNDKKCKVLLVIIWKKEVSCRASQKKAKNQDELFRNSEKRQTIFSLDEPQRGRIYVCNASFSPRMGQIL